MCASGSKARRDPDQSGPIFHSGVKVVLGGGKKPRTKYSSWKSKLFPGVQFLPDLSFLPLGGEKGRERKNWRVGRKVAEIYLSLMPFLWPLDPTKQTTLKLFREIFHVSAGLSLPAATNSPLLPSSFSSLPRSPLGVI